MYYSNGKRIFNDISIFSITTIKAVESIIGNKIASNQVIGAISIKTDKDCEIEFKYAYKSGDTQLPKFLKANGIYSFEDIREIKDVVFKGNIGTTLEIAIGV